VVLCDLFPDHLRLLGVVSVAVEEQHLNETFMTGHNRNQTIDQRNGWCFLSNTRPLCSGADAAGASSGGFEEEGVALEVEGSMVAAARSGILPADT